MPPLKVENLLPIDMQFNVNVNSQAQANFSGTVKPGKAACLVGVGAMMFFLIQIGFLCRLTLINFKLKYMFFVCVCAFVTTVISAIYGIKSDVNAQW